MPVGDSLAPALDVSHITNLSDISFRPYLGPSDIPAMLAVHEGCRERDRTDPFSVCYRLPNMSADAYEKELAASFADDQTGNVVLAESQDSVIGHSFLEWWNEYSSEPGSKYRVYLVRGWLLPEWRGRGIGTAMLRWAESRAFAMNAQAGLPPGELAANATDGEMDTIALLKDEGYQIRFLSPELGFDDFDRLPPATTPEGFAILPLEMDIGQRRAVARALIEANGDPAWTPEQMRTHIAEEEGRWTEFVAGCDPEISRIAWQDDTVAGLYLCRSAGVCGDIANVAVRIPYRFRGLSRSLMFHCLHAMRERGLRTARVYTGIGSDRNMPLAGPIVMYERFGFRILAYHRRYRKSMDSSR